MFDRLLLPQLTVQMRKGKVLVLYGARQVGKTTLIHELIKSFPQKSAKRINADDIEHREQLSIQKISHLKAYIGEYDIVVIDEAQRIKNIGLTLKILHEELPQTQFIATGSSSFDLANQINEPLTGRVILFTLYPLCISEIVGAREKFISRQHIEDMMIYGNYPDIVGFPIEERVKKLKNLADNYLYKDIFLWESLRKSDMILRLLQLLSLQIGQEVSYHELGQKLGLNLVTVQKYINLLEQSFVVFRLTAWSSGNVRNEVTKSQKVYFRDMGIRNAIIGNFQKLDLRNDVGSMWENVAIVERLKFTGYRGDIITPYFWRTYQRQEVDYIEQGNGEIKAFECKRSTQKKAKLPESFKKSSEVDKVNLLNPDSLRVWVIPE